MEDRNFNFSKENEDSSYEENNSIDSYYEQQTTFKLTNKNENNYWVKYLIFLFVYIPKDCHICHKKILN